MKLIFFALSAMLFISLNEVGEEDKPAATILRDTDGITIIEAVVQPGGGPVVVHIVMRPEIKKRIYIYWSTKNKDQSTRDHATQVRGGVASTVTLGETPGDTLLAIAINGYGTSSR
jgi:hypothetical protein